MPQVRHPKAATFVGQNLFAGLSTFAQLEARIAALPDAKSRGDAFEVFAEAYLATQLLHAAVTVWPLSAVPLRTLEKLGLSAQDYGVDGVFETVLGDLNVYQVKFRTGRTPLNWSELSTFMGLTDSPCIHSRILFSNCDELTHVAESRQAFCCVRGADLDRLEPGDFSEIEAWLAGATFVAPKKQPRSHQVEAMEALLPALEAYDRVSAIMACGTGKTLVALWLAEHRQASNILVLLPSLALLRQVLHEWLRETSQSKLTYMCVCSDPTVRSGLDEIATSQADLDFRVSTDKGSVRRFLDAPFDGTKIVFSTYQSARVVGAAMAKDEAFDFAVFDEAHKTAGRQGRNFAYALEDENLRIRKRLFLTATPRHYNPHQRDDSGDSELVFSMDRANVYGPQAYTLTFAEAARRNIICGYKVIISVITSGMVTNEIIERGDVLVNGDTVHARQVANQIAFRDAVEKYGVQKAFTFHRTVKSAESFVVAGSHGIRTHLPNFQTFHVNGTMSTATRERQMRDFRAADRAVMSNARCLTEGVDVPAVDMVAFLSPRRSQVDIVQATGRAMRQSPGKTTGYVLVPLYVEQAINESVDTAVGRAEFEEVWDVLNSLQEQDDVLAELIRSMGECQGSAKRFDDSRIDTLVEIVGIPVGLEALCSAVKTRCFERLWSSWDTYVGKLAAYREQFGDCNVPSHWKDDPSLGAWVSAQRNRQKKGTLSAQRFNQLEELGFDWDWSKSKSETTWMTWYRALKDYEREHGNANVPRTYSDSKLASWVWRQRQRQRGRGKATKSEGALTLEQVGLLDALNFRWDARDDQWADYLQQLQDIKQQHGHCEPDLVEGMDSTLCGWCDRQRSLKEAGKLRTDRIEKLDALGFPWKSPAADRRWREMFERLKEYHRARGCADVPYQWKEDRQLASWLASQRNLRRLGQLPEDRERQLSELNVTWKCRDVGTWEERLEELAAFRVKHGHCNIPTQYPENPKLGRFVNQMRSQRNRGALSADRIEKLDRINFLWESDRRSIVGGVWGDRYDELLRYKQEHGDCNVPLGWAENRKLGVWVGNQRTSRRLGRLSPERERLLDEAGFAWSLRAVTKN